MNNLSNVVLAAKTGGHIAFYGSHVSLNWGMVDSTCSLNNDYIDAYGEMQQAGGAIIFSGESTSNLGKTTLYRGELQVVDGAILTTSGLTVTDGSDARVLLRDAALNGTRISFGTASSLELQGVNTSTGSLTLGDRTTLTVALDSTHLESAALTLTGSVSMGSLSLNLEVAGERASGMYRILAAGSFATAEAWTAENVTVQGSGAAAGATFADLMWQEGRLYYVATPLWSNHSGSGVWSSTEGNWNNGSVFRAGQDVIFMDRGAGEVQLVGELVPASIHVQNTAGNDYAFTGSGKLSGETTLTKSGAGELTLATANDYTGKTELQEGTLNVHHSTALGATATGEASLSTATGSMLKVANNSHLVLAGEFNLAGVVDVAAGATLEMRSNGYVSENSKVNGTLKFQNATATTAILRGTGTVQVTDSQVSVNAISGFSGDLKVAGKGSVMSIESGSYSGTGTLSVAGGTLTFGDNADIKLNAGGVLELASWEEAAASVRAKTITVTAGATLAAEAVDSPLGEMPEITSRNLAVDLTCTRLTLYEGATLDAETAFFNLHGGMLFLRVTNVSSEKIELVLAEHAVYTGSEQIVLFAHVGSALFAYDGINTSSSTESLFTLNAADYFTGAGINGTTQLIYDSTSGTVYMQGVVTIPEPATATLSLLALAGLVMRRRRC